MTRLSPILLGVSLALAGGAITAAQDATPTPPKVLQITREWLKPGKSGMAHDKSEAAFVSLMNRAKLDGHYIALNSMSGKSRALYITRYPSFEAWEKDNKTVEKNASLAAEFDRDVMTDGELLDGLDQGVFTYDEELSLHPHPDVSHARYYEITAFHVKPGHVGDFMTLAQMYKAAVEKMDSSAHWAMYELAYGGEGDTYLMLTHLDSLTELDKRLAVSAKFVEAMGGPEAMQKFEQLTSQTLDPWRTELFSINPKQSYAEEAWIKADPDFWKPKAKTAEAINKPAAAKPVAAAKPGGR
jgi:hypothetical protein